MKSDKMAYIIYADIESLIKKIDGCANNPEFFNNRNWWAYSLWIFNVNKLGIWSHRKQTYFILRERLYKKVFYFFKKTRKKYNQFWKEKNVTINKRRIQITVRSKSMLHLRKNISKKKKRIIEKSEIIVILQLNIEA